MLAMIPIAYYLLLKQKVETSKPWTLIFLDMTIYKEHRLTEHNRPHLLATKELKSM